MADGQDPQHQQGQPYKGDQPDLLDHSDRWIWGVWIVVALVAVAILPFASRARDVAVAIASFCGVSLG